MRVGDDCAGYIAKQLRDAAARKFCDVNFTCLDYALPVCDAPTGPPAANLADCTIRTLKSPQHRLTANNDYV
jgi:hypothetical protein